MPHNPEIGAYEAKTKLYAFLRNVDAGERFTITQRGQPVAHLLPARAAERGDTVAAALGMRAFVDRRQSDRSIDVEAPIREGRD